MFICPKCNGKLNDIPPKRCKICKSLDIANDTIYLFSNENNLNLNGHNQYIGYDTLAEKYDLTRNLENDIKKKIMTIISKNIDTKNCVLDIGAGTGNFALSLTSIFDWVIAGDISISMLQKLKNKIDKESIRNIIPCKMNIYRLPVETNVLDMVFTTHIFHLIGNPDQAIYEIKRVLGPNKPLISLYFHVIEGSEPDINSEIEDLYYKELEKENIHKLSLRKIPQTGLHEYLTQHFKDCRLIESKDLIWKSISTPNYELEKTLSKQNSDQVLVDTRVHDKIKEKIYNQIENKYGKNFREIKIENTVQVKIGFYYG